MLPPSIGNCSSLVMLDLMGNHLTGAIPRSLGDCSEIIYLNLASNELTGIVPIQLGLLNNLEMLDLGKNLLIGAIPQSLSNCLKLVKLRLSFNNLTGHVPAEIGLLEHLELLFLGRNYLTGPFPLSLGNCTSLMNIDVQLNHLTGTIAPILKVLGALANMSVVYLASNNLTGSIPTGSMLNFTQLVNITLAINQLTGPIPSELGSLHYLQMVHLSQNSFVGSIPSSLGNCSNLIELELHSNKLTGPIPAELGLLHHLQYLLLWENGFTGSIPSSLGNCTELTDLEFQGNQLSGFIPSEITRLGSLQYFWMNENHLSGFKLTGTSNLTSLLLLDLHLNNLVGTIPTELGQLQHLQQLDLSENQLTGKIPWEAISNCSFLFYLSFSNNLLSGGIASSLGRLQRLENLYLQGNLLQGSIPDLEGFNQFSLLDVVLSYNQLNGSLPESLVHAVITVEQSFDLSHNYFSGFIPSWLGQLIKVRIIDLSDNKFSGTIPEGLDGCEALVTLNVSHNNLVGGIPSSVGDVTYLQMLDLSDNKLNGSLPSFLEHLQHLQFLNVSFNNFTGVIPVNGVFKHLNVSFFQGNPGLCGTIIQKRCMQSSMTHNHHMQLSWKVVLVVVLASFMAVSLLSVCILCYFSRTSHSVSDHLRETRKFTAEELIEATQGYSECNLVGEGALGEVYKGTLRDGQVVAVKRFRDGSSRESLLQEVRILSKLRHKNLVRILGCVLNLDVSALVLEFMSNGSLHHHLHEDTHGFYTWSWDMLTNTAISIANALIYLHHENGVPIIHGDVKPSNILLNSDLEAHLADFGIARLVKDGAVSLSSKFKGSIGYMAPELAYSSHVTTKVDVYSYGVVVLEMMTGKSPTNTQLDGLRLDEWVKNKLHKGVGMQEVLHASLLQQHDDAPSSSSGAEAYSLPNGRTEHMAVQLLQIGVQCTAEHPSHRPTMLEVLEFLNCLKNGPLIQRYQQLLTT